MCIVYIIQQLYGLLREHKNITTYTDHTMASLRHIIMGRNGDYFLNYIDNSKFFDAVLKLLFVI